MNCKEIRELLPDVAAGMASETPGLTAHVASCDACAAKLDGLRQTMALLDEWKVPEPSPYFDTRLEARLRDQVQRPASVWSWMRKPVLALTFAALIVAGALAVSYRSYFAPLKAINTQPPSPAVPVEPGTAVGDLQALEKNQSLYADFDVLDELQVQDDVTANP
jgi:anti-sigma factor RsiW